MKNSYLRSQFLNLRMDVKSCSQLSVSTRESDWPNTSNGALSSRYPAHLLRGKGNKLSLRFPRNFSWDSSQICAPTRPCNLTGADCASAIIIQASDRDDIAVAIPGVLKMVYGLWKISSISKWRHLHTFSRLFHNCCIVVKWRSTSPSPSSFANTKPALCRSSPPSYN